MARKIVKAINLDKAIKEILEKYGDDVYLVLDDTAKELAEESTKKLKAVTKWKKSHPGSPYSAAWTSEEFNVGRLGIKRVVYNDGHARLTHLLEKGHVSKNGTGRIFGDVKDYEHIKPVNDWVVEEIQKKVEEKISKL